MLAAYTPLSILNFEQAPAYDFDVGFDRIAEATRLNSGSKEFKQHYDNAKAHVVAIRSVNDLSVLEFFNEFNFTGFQLHTSDIIDKEFLRMADEEGWGSEEFILYSRQLLIQGVRAAGEVPAPIATFEEEFARLELNNGWKKRTPEYVEQWALA
jgi:hypothetical protein